MLEKQKTETNCLGFFMKLLFTFDYSIKKQSNYYETERNLNNITFSNKYRAWNLFF